MNCVRKLTEDLIWVGGNDRRIPLFEGVYPVPRGVSYNSYFIDDEKTVLLDTVDRAVSEVFFENIEYVLNGRNLDYVIVQHMEPDHASTLGELMLRYPNVKIVCNAKTLTMINQYYSFNFNQEPVIVKEGDTLSTGKHKFTFVMAPMVHWPEVMVTYDTTDKILFSADAFGAFGAINGAIFSDEVDFNRDYMDEARRYYTNIVGKYGAQVKALLKKASTLEINMICPLHGFAFRSNISDLITKYDYWSSYSPEEKGVVIAYASVYGNTANAAEILACRLRDAGIKVVMHDVSVIDVSYIIADCFRYSHFVFASTTYNAGIFVKMEDFLHDLIAHNIQKRTIGFIENGSWASTSGKLMREMLSTLKDITFLENGLSIKSTLKFDQSKQIDMIVEEIAKDFPKPISPQATQPTVEKSVFFDLSYGLYILSAKDDDKDNACIINTVTQITDSPKRISVAVNKSNLTHDMIKKTGLLNISILTESTPFKIFEHFGFVSGREKDKFQDFENCERSANGLLYITENTNSYISCKVLEVLDYDTHTVFITEVTEAKKISDAPSVTYDYYFKRIKPNPVANDDHKKGYVCKICGYFYEGDSLPDDYICPLCKHGVEDFERVE